LTPAARASAAPARVNPGSLGEGFDMGESGRAICT